MVVPPVRERREDVGLLIAALLMRIAGAPRNVRFTPAAGSALMRYAWPRNVRELEQVLGSAVALAGPEPIDLPHLPAGLHEPATQPVLDLSPSELARRDELCRLLITHGGNIAAVGRELGVARMQIHRWLERFAIDVAAFRR
jgi:transcriptional regulator of acetoin/glycerol metabolism